MLGGILREFLRYRHASASLDHLMLAQTHTKVGEMSIAKRAATIASLIAAIGISTAPAVSASPSGPFPDPSDFRNKASSKCLEVADWSTANGAAVRQWDCHGGNNQKWDRVNGLYVNRHSGKCIEIENWSTADGAAARQWDCHGGNNQKWETLNCDTNFACSYLNMNSGRVLEIGAYSTANGTRATQWSHNGGTNQKWFPF
ncbi:RICIN domain-containing protein [Streptomyces vinaceus]|uniref:RICIN domain-containing protein n=1 Tax=Streptomyces vinaceus TaxID=1960 RepID=UPI0035DD61B3